MMKQKAAVTRAGRLLLLLFVAFLTTSEAAVIVAASRAPVRARHGIVVSTSPLASDVGRGILLKGGNAVDAAVAVGFALAVVHPSAGNLGGGGFAVIHLAREGKELAADFREAAPQSAHRDMYLDPEGKVIKDLSRTGCLASGVPGSVAGLHLIWEECGQLPWKALLQPAIRLAEEGFTVNHSLSRSLRQGRKLLSQFPESKRIFLRDGDLLAEGDILKQPDLAMTLRRIAEAGPVDFYKGKTAKLIVQAMRMHGGLITMDDLARYEAKFRPPIRGTYRGLEIVSVPPPSSGGTILVEMLNIIEPFNLRGLGSGSSEALHLEAEVMRRAFADRAHYLGDPDFGDLPVDRLVSKAYARKIVPLIRRDVATPSSSVAGGLAPPTESTETTHYSIVDAAGNGVALTTTINGGYGSGVTIKGAGFLMNNEMDDFSSKPGTPNMYGLIQGEANSIGPGKRPLSAMTPTIVKRKGKLWLVLGSPGGPTIINSVFQIILNVTDFELNIQEAVDAPRIHHQWLPDELVVEQNGLVKDVLARLRAKGHQIRFRQGIGDAHSIMIDPETQLRLGAADPRSNSKASGY